MGGVMGGGQHWPADRPMPHYRPVPEYPPLPGGLPATGAARLPGHRPMPADRPADCTLPDELAALDYLLIPDYPPEPDRPLVADWPAAPDYPAVPHYLSVRDRPPVPDWPAGPAEGYRPLLRDLAGRLVPRWPGDARADRRAAVLGYLTVPVFGVPVVIYLATLRGPGWARRHTAQAVNVWFTGLLYDLSAVIMGAMLALDSPPVALMVFAPLVAGRWVVTLAYLARAARAAGRGGAATFPAWLCMRLAR
jgi:hypothetical protein